MSGLLLGMDLCDDYSQICRIDPLSGHQEAVTLTDEESSCLIPTVICKRKTVDTWFIGEEAYRRALFNEGIMVDKLINLAMRDGSATIEGVKYSAEELLYRFIRELIAIAKKSFSCDEIDSLVFSVQSLEGSFLDLLVRIAERCGIAREAVHILNHTECFAYYVLSQPKEVWTNICCMLDLAENGLHYYEMRVIRGRKPQIVEARHEKLEEGFSLDVLDSTSGEHMADTILTACAERLMDKKVISSVFLTGKGFVSTSWASGLLKTICNKRKVFAGQHVFASGAAILARDLLQEVSSFPFTCLCEGRIMSTISLQARLDGKMEKVVLGEAGTNWYEARASVELIPDGTDTLELSVAHYGLPRVDRIRVDLSELPQRPNKTTKIEVIVSFTSEENMTVRVMDRGFGELFPATGRVIRKDFMLE